MPTLTFDPPEWTEVELQTDTVLGGPRPLDDARGEPEGVDGPLLGRRVSFGRTQVRRLTTDDLIFTPQMRAFVNSTDDRFYALRFACSIVAAPDETLQAAVLAVELDGEAIAWSLAPIRLNAKTGAATYSVGAEITLSPFLKINGTWAPPEEQDVCWAYALGELESDPEWRLHAGRGIAITGPQSFAMIVRVPANCASGGTVSIGAQFARKGFLLRGRVETPSGTGSFLLP
jgi:hypothetical protein